MTAIEIQTKIDKERLKLIMDILKAMGIKAVVTEREETAFSKEDYIKKIEKARSDEKIKVSPNEQSAILGL